ncbi:MAG TPA: hypothetical protein VFV99_25280 [Kofleriaceae bacterium]|nr:hypothetical protein [Kofleriaceae bacterium]
MHAEGSSELRVTTSATGTFSVVAPADQALEVEAYGRRGGVARITVPAKGPSSDIVLHFAGTATLEGAITLGDDPISGAMIQLRNGTSSDRPYALAETDASGYFKRQTLEPGSYELSIVRNDSNSSEPIKYSTAVEVKAGANYANTDLTKVQPH